MIIVVKAFAFLIFIFTFSSVCEGEEENWRDIKEEMVKLIDESEAHSQKMLQTIDEQSRSQILNLNNRLIEKKHHKLIILEGSLVMPARTKIVQKDGDIIEIGESCALDDTITEYFHKACGWKSPFLVVSFSNTHGSEIIKWEGARRFCAFTISICANNSSITRFVHNCAEDDQIKWDGTLRANYNNFPVIKPYIEAGDEADDIIE